MRLDTLNVYFKAPNVACCPSLLTHPQRRDERLLRDAHVPPRLRGDRPPAALPHPQNEDHSSPIRSAAMNASCGMLTFLPAFAGTGRLRRSRILRMRVTLLPYVGRR